LDHVQWLAERGVILVEQPLPKHALDDLAWLTERSPIPIVADESVQRLPDVVRLKGVVHGINIKLMKCTGLREARQMITVARALGLKVMLGCMTETSCAVSAAAQLAPLADWADLDGHLLIANNPFHGGVTVRDGRIILPDTPGVGVEL
jgi:L-alanine-DL-glutamate epimerase-like enolase superfamily enzyme